MPLVMQLNVVSAEQELYSSTAQKVIVPGSEGDMGIMPQHTQLLSTLRPGEVLVTTASGEDESIYVSGGMVEIQPHVVTILSDTAIRTDELDQERAESAKQHAEQVLAEGGDDMDVAKAQAELLQSIEQLKLIENLRKRKSH